MSYDAKDELHGLFIPADSVNVIIGKRKRTDRFLCVYPDAFRLEPDLLFALGKLALASDPYNKVCYHTPELVDKVQVAKSERTLWRRLIGLRAAGAVKGKPPILFLNPFLVSKCDARVLEKLRTGWVTSSFPFPSDG